MSAKPSKPEPSKMAVQAKDSSKHFQTLPSEAQLIPDRINAAAANKLDKSLHRVKKEHTNAGRRDEDYASCHMVLGDGNSGTAATAVGMRGVAWFWVAGLRLAREESRFFEPWDARALE